MKLYEFFEDDRRFFFVMELYTGGELFDEIMRRERFTEADAADIIEQCLNGINYIHQQKSKWLMKQIKKERKVSA